MVIQAEPRLFFPGFEWEWHRLVLDAGNQQILPRSPNRISITFSSVGGIAISVSTEPLTALEDGLNLGDLFPPSQLLFRDIGPVLGEAWFGFDDFGGTALVMLEVSFNPELLAERSK